MLPLTSPSIFPATFQTLTFNLKTNLGVGSFSPAALVTNKQISEAELLPGFSGHSLTGPCIEFQSKHIAYLLGSP